MRPGRLTFVVRRHTFKKSLSTLQVFAGWNGTRHLALHRLAARRVKRGMKGVLEGWGAWAEQRSTRLSAVCPETLHPQQPLHPELSKTPLTSFSSHVPP